MKNLKKILCTLFFLSLAGCSSTALSDLDVDVEMTQDLQKEIENDL